MRPIILSRFIGLGCAIAACRMPPAEEARVAASVPSLRPASSSPEPLPSPSSAPTASASSAPTPASPALLTDVDAPGQFRSGQYESLRCGTRKEKRRFSFYARGTFWVEERAYACLETWCGVMEGGNFGEYALSDERVVLHAFHPTSDAFPRFLELDPMTKEPVEVSNTERCVYKRVGDAWYRASDVFEGKDAAAELAGRIAYCNRTKADEWETEVSAAKLALGRLEQDTGAHWREQTDDRFGTISVLKRKGQSSPKPGPRGSAKAQAVQFVASYAAIFQLSDPARELKATEVKAREVSFDVVQKGFKVGHLVVDLDESGTVDFVGSAIVHRCMLGY